ncbi:peptidylprolyl isomerase [Rubrimonas cliftonensis]|uniref:Parvulin-like PPIase n=1 Tax=Rubrimonas cliftonensis TaxID=89524 RepID=A0A1H3VZZ0_9RHOB|nr:peptidylprolyl isomerase [Rubrimonas cliftonensis]SDZ80393.1 periplasmic chaperone for outer membrane proteins SurA [Rubrimonas cliftonensis]
MLARNALVAAALIAAALSPPPFEGGPPGPWATQASAQTPFEPAAVVNGDVVTRYDVEQRARFLRMSGAQPGPELEQAALAQLTDDRIKLAAAEMVGLTVDEETLARGVREYAANRGLTMEALDAQLRRAGVDMAALEDAIAADIAWRGAVRRRFGAQAEPSDAELDQELALAATGQSVSYRLQELSMPFAARGEAETMALAEQLSRELGAGGDFRAAVQRYSSSPSAAQGGDIGWISEAALPDQVARELAATGEGGVTAPLPLPGGVTILKLVETRRETVQAGAETLDLVMLQARGATARQLLERVLQGEPDCATAQARAETDADLNAIRSDPTDSAAMQQTTRDAVRGLVDGQNSGPLPAQGGAIAFVVCSRVSGASPEAREALRGQVRSQRLEGFAAGWLQELRNDAVIDRR